MILERSGGRPTLIYPHHIYPLRIIKQIITMFFSLNSGDFRFKNEELVRFVLGKERGYLSPRYRFFVYYNYQGVLRSIGVSGKIQWPTGKIIIMSELTFPPLGYVLTFDSDPPQPDLYEITHSARFDYDDVFSAPARLPVLPTHLGWAPGDYRTEQRILEGMPDSGAYT